MSRRGAAPQRSVDSQSIWTSTATSSNGLPRPAALRKGERRLWRRAAPAPSGPQLKKALPKARILVRVDSGFTTPRVLAAIDRLKVSYLAGIGTNAAFEAEVEDHWVLLEATAECEQRSVRTLEKLLHQTRG